MIEFDLVPRADDESWSSSWRPPASRAETSSGLVSLTADDFVFRYFRIDVVLQINGSDFSLKTIGLPVMDFVSMLQQARWDIENSSVSTVETSQTQHTMSFALKGDSIEVSTNYSSNVELIRYSEFRALVARAHQRALDLLIGHHPDLRNNEYLTSSE